jgi:hypothetical protein
MRLCPAYARSLRCTYDTRQTTHHATQDKDDLDQAPVCPWSDHVAPLYNDINFQPEAIGKFVDGICRDDLNAIGASGTTFDRTGGLLRHKWGEVKSEYTIRVSQVEASGQGDSQDFPNFAAGNTYVMYLQRMVAAYALFKYLARRLLPADASYNVASLRMEEIMLEALDLRAVEKGQTVN